LAEEESVAVLLVPSQPLEPIQDLVVDLHSVLSQRLVTQ
jgi:hypothetical protein